MTNIQLYCSIGIPTLAVLTTFLMNMIQVNGIRSEVTALRDEMRQNVQELRDEIRELRQDMRDLVKGVHSLETRVAQYNASETRRAILISAYDEQGAWGPQLLWTLADGRKFYTPVFFQKLIDDEGIEPGQKFELLKSTEGRKTVWKVSPASKPEQPVAALLNGSGPLDSPIPEDDPQEDPPPVPITRLEHALKTAVHAANSAEKHGQSIGYNVRFSPQDIRAMAISVLIGMDRRAA